MPFGARFDPVDQVALADDADKGTLTVDHRHGADAVRQQNVRDLLNGRGRSDGNDVGNHHVGGFHDSTPMFTLEVSEPSAANELIKINYAGYNPGAFFASLETKIAALV